LSIRAFSGQAIANPRNIGCSNGEKLIQYVKAASLMVAFFAAVAILLERTVGAADNNIPE